MTTSTDIKKALMTTYAPPAHRLFFEVGNDTGTRVNRHIDALAVGIWPSVGYEISGIEIKVSRNDWKKEMSDPAKAQALMTFCDRWWLACPDGLISPDEVPATWGVYYLTEKGAIRVKKQAPRLTPEPVTKGFMAAVLRHTSSVDAELVDRLVLDKFTSLNKDFERRVESAVSDRVRSNAANTQAAIEIATTILELTGEDIRAYSGGVDRKAFAATYMLMRDSGLLQHLGQGWGGLAMIANNMRRDLDELEKLHAHPGLEAIRAAVNPPRKSR